MINTLKIRLTNDKTVATTFCLEPWGDAWEMLPQATYEVHFEIVGGAACDFPEIVTSGDAITVYSGGRGHVTVHENGREINSTILHAEALPRAA